MLNEAKNPAPVSHNDNARMGSAKELVLDVSLRFRMTVIHHVACSGSRTVMMPLTFPFFTYTVRLGFLLHGHA
jgi:hypothetical protein